jgi:hypothetical protein
MKHDNIHETPDVSSIHNEGVAHEVSDVNVGAIAKFTVGLLAFTLLTLLLMYLFKGFLEKQAEARPEDQRSPMAMNDEDQRKADIGPRLQLAPGFNVTTTDGKSTNLELREPGAEYQVLREDWKRILESGETDPDTKKPIILPIEEAKKKLLESGTLKSSASATPEVYDRSADMPSGASAGRLNEKRMQ